MKQEIYNPDGSLRAVIYDIGSGGRQEVHSASGQLLGVYIPEMDETFDSSGSRVGRGNLLMTLV
ncbi:MAG: hypothetical protein FWG77_02710 [Treponema sp.]|nr:hypothetical protein [Treponema sp.]